jgi:formamidopyrimidine-DNA glycosylase
MPETIETAKAVDFLRGLLFKNGKWMILVGATKFGNRFEHVNLELLVPALKLPISDIRFKGKEFFISLSNDITLHAHHMMGGNWSTEKDQHSHFEFRFVDENNEETFVYYNNKRFGEFRIFTTQKQFDDAWNRLAPGFLGTDLITLDQWIQSFKKFTKRKALQGIFMDQTAVCSGVGNYIFAECMYRAKLKPDKKLGDLNQEKLTELYEVFKNTIIGHYKEELKKVVYKKEFSPNGNPIEPMKLGSRNVWFCPKEQY